ncbi:MBL fold metallo-hydrolase [Bacillus salacetis]|uniref:MBL fold metallo-hydrolase n=1 Tax=Bacillus salacetis TaxID=2315464 RepID=A0A3A1R9Q1_9BACI|nr:MBL fold metallo-hydrolase [Bacillus salacetis]RIW38484.1 MBL fold metallo-hydrolase [Bacillus salacetis]
MQKLVEETDYFILYSLAEGVYAAISKPGQGAWSNAGIVDLGEELVVFDSMSTPSAGRDLKTCAEKITGKKVKYLVNSHYHGDHVFGNQAFYDSTLISTSVTRYLIQKKNIIDDVSKEKQEMEDYLDALKVKIQTLDESSIKSSLENQYNEMSKVLEDLPHLKVVLPEVHFEDILILEGTKRRAELHCNGGGHTPSDTFMYLPLDNIVFMSDLVAEGLHLPLYNPEDFKSILEKVKQLDIDTLIPGHGEIGGKDKLHTFADYVSMISDRSQEAVRNKVPLDLFISSFKTPEEFSKWEGTKGIKGNLTTAYTFYADDN